MNINRQDLKGIKGLLGSPSSIGTAVIPILFGNLTVILDIKFVIMRQDCQTLFFLNDLKENGLNLDVQRDKMEFGDKEQDLLLEKDFLKHKWPPSDMPYVLYTESELRSLHRNFEHPAMSSFKRVLKRFRLTIGTEKFLFNHKVAVDLMYIHGKPVIHVIDEATYYMAPIFIRNVSSEETWKGIV